VRRQLIQYCPYQLALRLRDVGISAELIRLSASTVWLK
jgi:hypothetical protein